MRKRETKEATKSLDALDAAVWKDTEKLNDKLVAFAESQEFITAFITEDAQQSPPPIPRTPAGQSEGED